MRAAIAIACLLGAIVSACAGKLVLMGGFLVLTILAANMEYP